VHKFYNSYHLKSFIIPPSTSKLHYQEIEFKGKATQEVRPVYMQRLAGPFYGQIQITTRPRAKNKNDT